MTTPTPTQTSIIEEEFPMQVDCIQSNSKHEIIAVGAYQLEPNPEEEARPTETESPNSDSESESEFEPAPKTPIQPRSGRIYILKLTPDIPGGFTVISELICPSGVLDLKFEPGNEDLLAVATAKTITLFEYENSESIFKVKSEININEESIALYLDWISSDKIIYSDSQGFVHLLQIKDKMEIIHSVKYHEQLAWVVHYSRDQELYYSGCDGGVLKVFKSFTQTQPLTMNFPIGLTSIKTNKSLTLIGSYDDTLKIYKVSEDPEIQLQILNQINLGGAPWRIQILPEFFENCQNFQNFETNENQSENFHIAAACSRNGIKLIQFLDGKIETVYEFDKYKESLAYGLHVVYDKTKNIYNFNTCYFDNHVVHVFDLSF